MPARVRITLLSLLVVGLHSTSAAAQASGSMPTVPGADAFSIYYYLTDKDGKRSTLLSQQYFLYYFNKARCECGVQLQTQLRVKSKSGVMYDTTKLMETYVGTNCAMAETNPVGQFKKCAQLESATTPQYILPGVTANFHPIWLAAGIDPASPGGDRSPGSAWAAGTCDKTQGTSGVWVCAQTNGTTGCQTDEFIINGTQNNNLGTSGMAGMQGISFDFLPPVTLPSAIDSAAGDEAILVSWTSDPGDVYGYRVLCEEADTGLHPPGNGEAVSPPAINATPRGNLYFTKNNVCPDGPFSVFTPGPSALDNSSTTGATTDDSSGDSIGDSTTTTAGGTTGGGTTGGFQGLFAATTSTTDVSTSDTTDSTSSTDTTSTTGTTTVTGTTAAAECGNLMIEGDEECDDGNRGPGKLCKEDCTLNVCGDGDKSPDEQCDDGKENGDDALCGTDCVLHISDGMRELDWGYVCSAHLPQSSRSVRITGLENYKRYNFMLVAYDRMGNPVSFSKLVSATPVKTNDVWDQCHELGDVCGKSGFCNVAGDGDPLLGLGGLLGLGLGFAGLRRRKRNRA